MTTSLLLAASMTTACQGSGGSGDSRIVGAAIGTDGVHGTSTPTPDFIEGEAAGPNTITLALRYVSYLNSAGTPVIDEATSQKIVRRVNELYAPCDVRFFIEEYVPAIPGDLGLAYGMSSMSELDPIRSQFESQDRLVVINTGNWSAPESANAWTTMPGYSPSGAVLEAQVATNGEIVAHEIGHYLNLDHVSTATNLLSPIVYKTSTVLTARQCEIVRQSAVDSWSAMRR
ncbi:MAG: hypothetical protein A2X94_05185 [Bdellovibrionales bacterium GWB1_55_8]|nr:MAG: hypothetical protein A2X94_05185 [Bdellovibrionales bacterium GWB1_55_8]